MKAIVEPGDYLIEMLDHRTDDFKADVINWSLFLLTWKKAGFDYDVPFAKELNNHNEALNTFKVSIAEARKEDPLSTETADRLNKEYQLLARTNRDLKADLMVQASRYGEGTGFSFDVTVQ